MNITKPYEIYTPNSDFRIHMKYIQSLDDYNPITHIRKKKFNNNE